MPATIALLDGRAHVGLDQLQLERLARTGVDAVKCSRRDLAYVLATSKVGATTVAGTMYIANLAGLSVFVTGGIGGVHRGVEETMDVSADLTELGRTPICVVCAGVKSILDIPRTLEYLETSGVAVMGYKTEEFPAFFTEKSGERAPLTVQSALEVADWIRCSSRLGLHSGCVVAVPNPAPADYEVMKTAIDRAMREAQAEGVHGKAMTPFLLSRINEHTGGHSLQSNIALVKHNAAVGAKIAVGLRRLQCKNKGSTAIPSAPHHWWVNGDSVAKISPNSSPAAMIGTSSPGIVTKSHGGVGRNVSETIAPCARAFPHFMSLVGDDADGRTLLSTLSSWN